MSLAEDHSDKCRECPEQLLAQTALFISLPDPQKKGLILVQS